MSKEDINLPKTSFSMKANLPIKEPEILKIWEKLDLYKKLRELRKGKEKPMRKQEKHMKHQKNRKTKNTHMCRLHSNFNTRAFDCRHFLFFDITRHHREF